jgi:hypothetical protein
VFFPHSTSHLFHASVKLEESLPDGVAVVSLKPSVLVASLALLVSLSACANSPLAEQLERSIAADPRLQTDATGAGDATSPTAASGSPSGLTTAQLPANFPAEIPRYPNAELIEVTEAEPTGVTVGANSATQTRWQTSDVAAEVQKFYREQFQTQGWQLSPAADPESTTQPLQASRDGLQVTVATVTSGDNTEFTLDYQFATTATESPTTTTAASPEALPQPGDPDFIGPVLPAEIAAVNASPTAAPDVDADPTTFADLDQAPPELQPYIADLAKIGALPTRPLNETSTTGSELKPNAEISRRDYARWLVAANNRIYANQPARQIRLATASGQPAFQDVPTSDPDFGVIQGLANAGLIPSPLSGDSTTVTFRPDAPLTREELILWKVPVDTRQALPTASIESVQQTWGFQDATKIDPRALRAVLADYQNGDLSNIRRAFGYTTLFQPKKTVSRAEAAAVLWQFGSQGNGLSAKDAAAVNQPAAQGG